MTDYGIDGWYVGTSSTSSIAADAAKAVSTAAVTPVNAATDNYYYSLYTHNNMSVPVTISGDASGTVAFTGMAADTVSLSATGNASVYYNKTGSVTITPPAGYGFSVSGTGGLSGVSGYYSAAETWDSITIDRASSLTVTYTCIPTITVGGQSAAVSMNVGTTAVLDATHSTAYSNHTHTFSSSDSGVASVAGSTLTALTNGTTTIAATCDSVSPTTSASNSVTVTVNAPVFTLKTAQSNLKVGSTTSLPLNVTDNIPSYSEFWYSLTRGSGYASEITDGTYFDIKKNGVNDEIVAKQPTGNVTVYYVLKAGTDASHLTYTSSPYSFTVSVATPSIRHSSYTDGSAVKVNSQTMLSAQVNEGTKPQYYEFEYSLSNESVVTSLDDPNNYLEIDGLDLVAIKPTDDNRTVYYRIKAGTAAGNITYTSGWSSFNVAVATPSIAFANPTSVQPYLLAGDTAQTAALNAATLESFGLSASDVTWEIANPAPLVAGRTVVSVNATSGALTPTYAGTASIVATVHYNSVYSKTETLNVTVQDPTLTITDAAYDAEAKVYNAYVYVNSNSEAAKRAMDYTDTTSFTVGTNANDPAYASVTGVEVVQMEGEDVFRIGTTSSPDSHELELTANSTKIYAQVDDSRDVATGKKYKLYVKYYINGSEVMNLRKTVYLHVMPYVEEITIYFNDNANDQWTSGKISVYTYPEGGDGSFKDNQYGSSKFMTKIGTVGTKNVYAGTYKKTDLIGPYDGVKYNVLFNSYVSSDAPAWYKDGEEHYPKQTVDVQPDGDCFDDFTYFYLTGEGDSNQAYKQKVGKTNYGNLKPTKAVLTSSNPAMPNNGSTTLSFDLEADGYTYGATTAITGYYEFTSETDTYVTRAPSDTSGTLGNITGTAAADGAGDDTISGYLYFTADGILETPKLNDAGARNFIGLQFDTVTLTVTAVKAYVHMIAVTMDSNAYAVHSYSEGTYNSYAMSATGTGASEYTDQSTTIRNNIGADVTVSKTDIDGYTFVGYYVRSQTDPGSLGTALSADTVPTSTDSTVTITTNEIRKVDSVYYSDYYVYGLYRKQLNVSASKSYEYNATAGTYTFISAPPKTVVINRDGEDIAEYTYDASAVETSPLTDGKGTYGKETDIPVLAGDKVTLTYASLASSNKISDVFKNTSAYADQPTSAVYNAAVSFKSSADIDQTKKSVQFTVDADRRYITISLGSKHRITFVSEEGFEVTGMNIGGYYADGEAISFSVEKATSTNCTYVLGDPTDDEGSAYPASPSNLHGISYDSGVFSGTMPEYDVVINMNIVTKYLMQFHTKVLSDVVGEKTELVTSLFAEGGGVTVKYGDTRIDGNNATESVGNSNDAGTLVTAGGNVVYSISGLDSSYMFLGWYKSAKGASAPDLQKGFLSSKTTFSYKPSGNVKIWAVATRNFYIAGNFEYDSGRITHKQNTLENNTDFKTTYLMDYDAAEGAYAITFKSFAYKDSEGNITAAKYGTAITDKKNTSGDYSYSDYAEIFLFKCYSADEINDDNLTYWNNVENYSNSYIQYGTSSTGNDHMFYGKTYESGGAGMFDYTEKTEDDGYAAPVTLYFKPSADANGSKWYVRATKVWPDIYISGGYSKIDDTYTNSTDTDVYYNDAVLDKPTTYTDPQREEEVYKYNIPSQNAEITLKKTLSNDSYEVPAFVVYDITNDKVYSLKAEKTGSAGSYTYSADLKIGYNSLYIVPVIQYCGNDAMTVYFNSEQMDTDEWGDLVSCYAWYADSEGTTYKVSDVDVGAFGSYPGQVMVPSTDGKSWSAKFRPTCSGGTYTLAGITFANYYDDSDYTWFADAYGVGSGKPITQYNSVQRSNNAAFNKTNCKVQTYDYREPIAMYRENTASAVLSFSVKTGNTNYLTVSRTDPGEDYTDDLEDMNVLTIKNAEGKKKYEPSFEYLTNAAGDSYVDLAGTEIVGQPTPSFYIIAKGMVSYTNSSMTAEFKTGNEYDTVASNTRTYDVAGVSMVNGVQWYVYDANGDYIMDILSAAYSDDCKDATGSVFEEGSTKRIIAKRLEMLGYAVNGKSAAISYDYPRMCYTNNNTTSTFDAFRFTGQWYKTSLTQRVTVHVQVGVLTESGPEFAGSNSANYGTATAVYNSSKGDPGYINYIAGDSSKSYVTTAIGDAPNQPVKLSASNADTFIGWYYYDSKGNFVKADHSSNEDFYPAYSGNSTYYAMYQVKSSYMFIYKDRDGNDATYEVEVSLSAEEMAGYPGNGNIPNVPTFDYDAAVTYYEGKSYSHEAIVDLIGDTNPYTRQLEIFKNKIKTYGVGSFVWPAEPGPNLYADAGLTSCVAIATPVVEKYTVTWYEGDHTTSHDVTEITANYILTFNSSRSTQAGFKYAGSAVPDTYNSKAFSYWSSDDAGEHPLTNCKNYGLIVTHNMTIYAQYGKDTASMDEWMPIIEAEPQQSRTIESGSDKMFLDYDLNFVNMNDQLIQELNEATKNIHFGLAIVYSTTTKLSAHHGASDESVGSLVKALINANRSSGRSSSLGVYINSFDKTDPNYISDRNRSHYAIKLNSSDFAGAYLTAYAYVYDSSTGNVYISSGTETIVNALEFTFSRE